MAHHGYERPGWGVQTSSCGGILYKCLQVSDEGLRAMLKSYVESLANHRKQLAELPRKTEIVREDPYSGKPKTYTPSDPKWAVVVAEVRNRLQSTIRQLEQNIPILENEIRNWKPTEVRKYK